MSLPSRSALHKQSLSLIVAISAVAPACGKSPTAEQALDLKPIQPGVVITTPTGADVAACTIAPEKSGGVTAWVVRDGQGRPLRRFADTNADNVVDLWAYYHEGGEVYRDIDADFDSKADQYRWLGTAGARWALDADEDGKPDSWKSISPHEVAEEVVAALSSGDMKAFERVLLTQKELGELGLSAATTGELKAAIDSAPQAFKKAASDRAISASVKFVDFGSSRPGAIAAGVDGATQDTVIYESATVLIETGADTEQIQLGPLVQVGSGWRVVAGPKIGSEPMEPLALFQLPGADQPTESAERPNEQMQQLMAELEKLDRASTGSPNASAGKRAELLNRLASVSTGAIREQWIQQLADTLSADVLENKSMGALKSLDGLANTVERGGVSKNLAAHVRFQRIWAEYGMQSQDAKQDYSSVQKTWLEQLEKFAADYPESDDTAEALLQLGMAAEFAGESEQALKRYEDLATQFTGTPRGAKAAGALRRLKSIGQPIALKAPTIDGGTFDVQQLAGKHVLIHYWATWCEPCKSDMAQLKEMYAKSGSGLAIVGVNLDSRVTDAKAYLAKNRLPWVQVYDEGGLEGRLASEMGVMTLPLMIVLDDKGRVVNRNIHVAELETEIRRLIR